MRKKVFSVAVLLIALLFLGDKANGAQDIFLSNLKQGDLKEDVKLLQIVLNSNPETRLADSGPGSPGEETLFFGRLTLNAVNRFQDLYKNDVLIPLGLFAPTGFVGPSTRRKLNEIAPGVFGSSGNTAQNSPTNTQSNSPLGSAVGSGFSSLAGSISDYLQTSPASQASLFQPFGGQILAIFPCPCSGNTKLTIGPPNGGEFILEPTTIIKDYGNVSTPGAWVLGLYRPAGVCLVPVPDGCAPLPNQGSIHMIGTSAF